MSDAVELAVAEILNIAGSLGLPVEVDYPYDPDSDELPMVLVDTGEEEVLEDEDMPAEGWTAYWRLSPSIEVIVNRIDPMTLHAELSAKWATLRQAIDDSDLLSFIREGTKPQLRKLPIVIEGKPGVAGFAVQMSMEIERD
ncbi:hypothetical protein [Sagittula sp. MA-2]|jgi:hypothetical protein|uniref:hypothetical protein n=1 Tax=Sagittula sp. MA-2 TaxID=3048007 RepID=UPI0024C351FD|nr:hypothetical protein [Sagittula sp. MA-2]WHZ36492.1 hypothetical protein QNI11_05640 [Sagittula sp. MA-2]